MVTLTEQEKELFRQLSSADSSKILVGYIQRLCDTLCDARTLKDIDQINVLARVEAAKCLEEYLVKFLRQKTNQSISSVNEFI